MIMTATCPIPSRLQGVLDNSLTAAQQADVVAHLDSCTNCQMTLERMAAGDTGIIEMARRATEEPRPERTSAFWPALNNVERAIDAPAADLAATGVMPMARDRQFDFLDPADGPATLGRIDRFSVVEMVGRGGMGMVFRAIDDCLQRTVAIKVLDPQYAKNELAQSRFCREARAAAAVSHENVVTIHHVEYVEAKDLSYIVMQFVKGRSLQDVLDQGDALPVREAVRIAAATAAGLAAAHANGLIHRDIKPGNILLEQSSGRVLLTDFGLARLTEDVKLTQTGFVAGTPLYMSPEQARGDNLDARADLFSLGGVLYAMLAGQPPFQGASAFAVLRQVTDTRHRPVQLLNPAVPDSLAEIVDQLLEKDPQKRYAAAAEVAAALNDELARMPAVAPPPRSSSRLFPRYSRSWWRRNSFPILLGTAASVTVLVLSEATALTHWTVLGQRGQAPAERLVEIPGSGSPAELPDTPTRYAPLRGNEGAVWSVAFDPCDELLATAAEDGTVKFWDAREGVIRGELNNKKYRSPVWSIGFNQDGTKLVTASDDGFVRLWDVKTRQEAGFAFKHPFAVRCAALSPDGKKIASGTRNGAVTIWNAETGDKIHGTTGHEGGVVMAIAFSPDGKLVASAGSDKTVKLWDVEDGSARATLTGHTGPVYAVAFDPTSQVVASAGWDRSVRLWDATKGSQTKQFEPQQEDIWSLAFCPLGKHLLTGGQDRTAKWLDVETGAVLATFRGHGGPIHGVAVSKDGRLIAAGGRDGSVRVWDAP